jgi:4-amino-4-deoxy-L-arabinose transferase-like glycosyltransferase
MRAGRLVSMVAGLGLVLGAFLLGRALWPRRPYVALAGAAFAAFLPESLFIAGAMSNDMLAAMWATLALWLALSARGWRGALLTGVCLGLAFITKASAGSLAVVAAAALFVTAWPRGARWPGIRPLFPAAGRVAVAGAAAFAIAAPWLARNWQLYGDPFGWPVVLATIDQRQGALALADVWQLLRGWWLSFWGKFGGAGHIPLPSLLYVAWAAIGAAALSGWIRWVLRRKDSDNLIGETSLAGWIVLLGAPLITAAGIYSYSKTALGTDQGRLLFPALAPLALLVAGGLSAWAPRGKERAVALAFSGSMAVLAVAALLTGLLQPFAPPPPPSPAALATANPVAAQFGPLELAASAWDGPALTLYWRATEPPADDLRTALRALDAEGNLLWEWKRSPGAGRFSTDRWPAGHLVADTYRIPPDALARVARVEVGVRPFPEQPFLPPSSGEGDFLALPLAPSALAPRLRALP